MKEYANVFRELAWERGEEGLISSKRGKITQIYTNVKEICLFSMNTTPSHREYITHSFLFVFSKMMYVWIINVQ